MLRPVGWDEALDLVADAVRGSRTAHGADAVGVFGGGGLTNEKAYQLGKFARLALGTSRIDYNGRFCMSSAAAAGNRAFGIDRGLPFPLTDLDGAGTILLLGSNVAETMPPFVQHLQGARDAGGLIVVDPRRSATAAADRRRRRAAPAADARHRPRRCCWACPRRARRGPGRRRTTSRRAPTGCDAVAAVVAAWWPERVAGRHGRSRRACCARPPAGWPSAAPPGGGARSTSSPAAASSSTSTAPTPPPPRSTSPCCSDCPARAGSGYGTLTGQGNGQGGREHGQKCDQLPGYRKITDPAHRAHVAGRLGRGPSR